ncbi:hypothetical protein [Inmirania thermothiophila]|uniref:Uncharacterized protein n=1 Tax=Inmirania thermothiophila TaxID=1750597 RepID=A0A3N1XTR2_9GAMM|nr:hypothetical protein [Inmirania thermothiophila]ROR29648.1 hypothetical protein EDC57_2319 [Inmirania thermothiophila]
MDQEQPTRPGTRSGEAPAPDRTRRRLTGAGLAAPVLLSVAARPAWGNRCTLSAQLSGNLSAPTVTCEGLSPGYWKNHTSEWDHGTGLTYRTELRFHDPSHGFPVRAFPDTGTVDFGDRTLLQVLQLTGGDDPKRLGFHAVAAVLNAQRFYPGSFGYAPGDIVDIYRNWTGTAEDLKAFYEALEVS